MSSPPAPACSLSPSFVPTLRQKGGIVTSSPGGRGLGHVSSPAPGRQAHLHPPRPHERGVSFLLGCLDPLCHHLPLLEGLPLPLLSCPDSFLLGPLRALHILFFFSFSRKSENRSMSSWTGPGGLSLRTRASPGLPSVLQAEGAPAVSAVCRAASRGCRGGACGQAGMWQA